MRVEQFNTFLISVIALVAMLFISQVVMAQKFLAISRETENAFEKKFPEAVDVKWKTDSANFAHAEFSLHEQSCKAFFASDLWVRTEIDTLKEKVPPIVQLMLLRSYTIYTVTEIKWIECVDKQNYFGIKLQNGKEGTYIRMSNRGQLF